MPDTKGHILYNCLYEMSQTVKSIKTKSRRVVGSAGADGGKWVVTANEHMTSYLGDKQLLK